MNREDNTTELVAARPLLHAVALNLGASTGAGKQNQHRQEETEPSNVSRAHIERHPTHGGVREQTRQVLQNVQAILEAAGSGLDNVIKTTCFLADIKDFGAFNEVYREFFAADPPARSTVQVGLVPPWLVEIEAVAVRP